MTQGQPGNLSFLMAVMSVMALRYNFRDTHPWDSSQNVSPVMEQIRDILPQQPDLQVEQFEKLYPVPIRVRLGMGLDYHACKKIVALSQDKYPPHEHYLVDPTEFDQASMTYYGFIQADADSGKPFLPQSLAEMLMMQYLLAKSSNLSAPIILGQASIPIDEVLNLLAEHAISVLAEPAEEDADFDDNLVVELAPAMAVIYMAQHLASYVISDYCAQIHGDPNHRKYLSDNNLAYKFDPTQSIPMVADLFGNDVLGGNYPWRGFIEKISKFLLAVNGQNSPTFAAIKNILGFTEAAQFAMGGVSIDEFMAGLGQDKSGAWEKLPDTIVDEMPVYLSANQRPVDRGFRQMARIQYIDLNERFKAETGIIARILDRGHDPR